MKSMTAIMWIKRNTVLLRRYVPTACRGGAIPTGQENQWITKHLVVEIQKSSSMSKPRYKKNPGNNHQTSSKMQAAPPAQLGRPHNQAATIALRSWKTENI